MIINDSLEYYVNENGHLAVSGWKHGITNVRLLTDTDVNFKPYLYLFKYMKKSERIGKSFIHTSRNFDKIQKYSYDYFRHKIKQENLVYQEKSEFQINNNDYYTNKLYYKK